MPGNNYLTDAFDNYYNTNFLMPRFLLTLLPLFFLLSSCEDDAAVSNTSIEGRWELERARRNNMETQMLEGLFYEFAADSTLKTNLMGNEAPGTYSLQGTTVTTSGIKPQLEYEIVELNDSSLHLRTELLQYRFDFLLKR